MEPLTAAQPQRNLPGATMVPMPREETVVFSVRMPRDLHERLVKVSRADHSTVNRSIVVAVERYIRQMNARRPRDAAD